MDGGFITFEIEVAELTAQNLVEENAVPVGRLEENDEQQQQTDSNNNTLDENENGGVRLLRVRSLQQDNLQRTKQQSSGGKSIIQTDESLDVIITFDGFTIGINPDRMSELLVSGIEGIDFTRELQQSRIDFFSEATVSSATETAEKEFLVDDDVVEDDVESNSRFSVLISYMVPIVVIGFALGSLFYHKCYGKGKQSHQRHSNAHRHQNAIERAQIGGTTATPMAAAATTTTDNDDAIVIANNSKHEENNGSHFNFHRHVPTSLKTVEETENGRTNQVEDGQSAFTRFVTALNLHLAITKSKNSSTDEEANEADEGSNTASVRSSGNIIEDDRIPIISDDLVSPMSGISEINETFSVDEKSKFKAYASVLPPMIVIDNIDNGPDVAALTPVMMATSSTAANSKGLQDSSVRSSSTPLEELDTFASEFRKQISRSSSSNAPDSRHPSYAGSFYGTGSSSALDVSSGRVSLFGPKAEDEDDDRLIEGIVSDEWDGDDLFSPIPSNITTNDGEIDNEQDPLPNPEQISSSSNSDENDEASLNSPVNVPIDAAKHMRIYGTWDGSPSSSEVIANLNTKLSSSSMPAVLHRGAKMEGPLPKDRAMLPPKRPPTPEMRQFDSDQQHQRLPFPKPTPFGQALIGGSNNRTGCEGHWRKSSTDTAPDLPKNSSSVSALSTDDLIITGSKSDGSNHNTNKLEFEAPRKGNWGLVLEYSSRTGPRIYTVKDYSPLFGLVQKGDKLLEIDGKNVSQSNLTDVTKLLKGKSSSYPYHRPTSSTIPIIISRSSSYNNIESPAVLDNSFLSRNGLHHQHNGDYNHKRHGSYGSYDSAESSGSRVVEDVDDDNNNGEYYLDHHQEQRQTPFDYDSRNEI